MTEAPTLQRRSAIADAETLRAARRDWNREGLASHRGLRRELQCECAQTDCHATVPPGAEAHRRRPGRFIVVPRHLAGEKVVAAADHFFVVEL